MKTLRTLCLALITTLFFSCSGTQYFPVSKVVPGAIIKVDVSKDKYKNTLFKIETEYLTKPERLTPPQKIYVVWVKTNSMGVINLGKLYSDSPNKATLRTLSPFEPEVLFITAEESAFLKQPEGIEITRLDL